MRKRLKTLWYAIWPSLTWGLIKWAVGAVSLTALYAVVRATINKPISVGTAAVIFGLLFCLILGISIAWRRKQSAALIVYLPIFIGLAFCVWAYFIGQRVSQMSDDVRHLQAQAIRYVLPRELTKEQSAALVEQLSKRTPPLEVRFVLASRDEEAGQYGGDLQNAFRKAGWKIGSSTDTDQIQEGLSIEVYNDVTERGLSFQDFFQVAFREANIQLDGGGGGGSNDPGAVIRILVGHRRRDKHGIRTYAFDKRHSREQVEPTDDDF
jgi:hypothetical protein